MFKMYEITSLLYISDHKSTFTYLHGIKLQRRRRNFKKFNILDEKTIFLAF